MSSTMVPSYPELIRSVPDFPKPGILFRDITPVLANADAFRELTLHFSKHLFPETTKLLAIESRGFLLGSALAQHAGLAMILARKPGKLPRAVTRVDYDLEYGRDALEVHSEDLGPGDRVTIIDDVLATGGTAHAAERLAQKSGAKVLGSLFMMELTGLKGGSRLANPYRALLRF